MFTILKRWFQPPYFPNDEDKTRSALLLNVVFNTFTIAMPVLFVGVVLGNKSPRYERTLIIIACAWLTIFVTRRIMLAGRVATSGMVTVIIIFVATTLAVYNVGTIRAPATAFYILSIVMAGLIISRRAITSMASLSAIAVLALLFGEKADLLPAPALTVTITQGITFTVVFTIISILLYLAVKSIDEALTRVRLELTERQRTEEKLRASEERLAIIHEIDRSLISARSSPEIAKDALIRIRQLIPCARASVTLFDFDQNEATFLAADFDGMETIADTPMPLNEFGLNLIAVLKQNKPWFTNNMLNETEITELDKRLVDEHGIYAWLTLPLLYQGQLVGALNLGRGIGESFTATDAATAQDIANQLAIAVQQTRLYEALQVELTERQNLIAQLEANNAELERFTYTVSHDLRNPLVTIMGFLGMLDKDIRENRQDRIQSDFQRIAGATDKMDALLTDLLELSRIGRIINPPEEVDLIKLSQEVLELLDARIRTKNVTMSIAPNLPDLYGDRLRLREVLENLISNAVKYIGDQPNPSIEIGSRRESNEPVIYVKDNGIGIEERYQTRIFALFEKLSPAVEGTGVGLTLVKRIIETHGGRIWVESEGLGKGSTFCFTIPDDRK